MEITPLAIEGAWLAHSPVWSDQRGYFREWFKVADVEKVTGRSFSAEQGNISESSRGTVRGIHYSIAQRGQAKWVTCVTGSIKDYIVDIRPESKSFGKWIESLAVSGSKPAQSDRQLHGLRRFSARRLRRSRDGTLARTHAFQGYRTSSGNSQVAQGQGGGL